MAGTSVSELRAQQRAQERAQRLLGTSSTGSSATTQAAQAYAQGHSGGTTSASVNNVAKSAAGIAGIVGSTLLGAKSPTGLLTGLLSAAKTASGSAGNTQVAKSGTSAPASVSSGTTNASPAQILAQGQGPLRTATETHYPNNPTGDTGFALAGATTTPTSAANNMLDSSGQTDWSKYIQQGLADGVDAATMQAYLDGRNAKIAAAGGVLDQYLDDPIAAAAKAYIKSKTPAELTTQEQYAPRQEQYDSYQDLYDRGGYDDVAAKQQELMEAQLAQLENGYNGQRGSINSSAEEQARQAYIAYMQSLNTLPQQLAAAGFSGGLADSQRLALDLGYQNNQREILQGRDTALNEVETALNNARLQTTVEGIQAQSDLMRDAVAAYQNWVSQNNSFAHQSQLSAQEANQSLSNQLAILQAQQKAQAQQQDTAKLLESAQSLAQAGDYSLMGAYYGWTPEQTAYMNAWHTRQVNDPKALESAQILASMGDYNALGGIYSWTPEQIAYAQNYFSTEKTSPQSQEYVLAMLGKGMMPDSALLAAANIPQSFAEAMIQAYERDQLKTDAADRGAIGDLSGYQQLGWDTNYLGKLQAAELQKIKAAAVKGSNSGSNPTSSPVSAGQNPYYDLVLSHAMGLGVNELDSYLSGVMITESNPDGLITPEEADTIFRALGGDPEELMTGTSKTGTTKTGATSPSGSPAAAATSPMSALAGGLFGRI